MGKIDDSMGLYDRFLTEHRRVSQDPDSRAEEVWSSPEAGAEWTPERLLPIAYREPLQEDRLQVTVEISEGRLVSQLTPAQMRQGSVTIDYILNGRHATSIAFELTPACGPLVASAPLPDGFSLAERDPVIIEAIWGNKLVGFRELQRAEIGAVANAYGYFVSITRHGVAIGWATDRDAPDREVSLAVRVDGDFETVAFTQGQWTRASTVERRFAAKIPDRYADARLHRLTIETSGSGVAMRRTPVYFAMNANGCLLISPVEATADGRLRGVVFNSWGAAEDKATAKIRFKDGTVVEGPCDQPSPPAYDFLGGAFAFSLDHGGRGLADIATLTFAEATGRISVGVPPAELIVTPEPWPKPGAAVTYADAPEEADADADLTVEAEEVDAEDDAVAEAEADAPVEEGPDEAHEPDPAAAIPEPA